MGDSEASLQRLLLLFDEQRSAFLAAGAISAGVRRDRLTRAIELLVTHEAELCEAIALDFGQRPASLTRFMDIFPALHALKFAEVTVVTGGQAVAESFARLPFDHLLFTGSTQVGRRVMAAAAQSLVPVTLELGGKCPVIVSRSANLTRAVDRIPYSGRAASTSLA